jgi:hypothetical protein
MNNEENDCPLSSKDWILFLSGEISNLENEGNRDLNTTFPVFALFTTAMAIIISSVFSTANSSIQQDNKVNIFISLVYAYNVLEILFFIFLVVFIYVLIQLYVTKKKADKLKTIRNNIIDGSLNDTNETRERWRNVMQARSFTGNLIKIIKIFDRHEKHYSLFTEIIGKLQPIAFLISVSLVLAAFFDKNSDSISRTYAIFASLSFFWHIWVLHFIKYLIIDYIFIGVYF